MGKLKSFLRNFVLTRGLYRALWALKNRRLRQIKKNMKSNGPQTVFLIEDILSKNNLFFYMDMGTMLGIVREGRLLGHDLDIDVAVYANTEKEKEQIKNALTSAGCKLKYSYVVEEIGTVEESFELNDLKFDVNYYLRDGDKDICYLMYRNPQKNYNDEKSMDVVKLSVSAVKGTKKIPFFNQEVTVPQNPEKYLAERYGENWRIPDKFYVYWKGPSTEITNYKGYRRTDI